jgi:hypothetical protein
VQTQPEPVLSGYRTLFGGPRVSTGSVKNRFPGIYQAQTVFFFNLETITRKSETFILIIFLLFCKENFINVELELTFRISIHRCFRNSIFFCPECVFLKKNMREPKV